MIDLGRPLPAELSVATGQRGETLVLMVCATWLWAGRYSAAPCASLIEVAASASRIVRASHDRIALGGTTFPLNPKAAQAARRWLDRQGVSIRTIPTSTRDQRTSRGNAS